MSAPAGTIGIISFPEGTAVINIRGLLQGVMPVLVEYGGARFVLTGWNDEHEVFDAIGLQDGETAQQAHARVVVGMETQAASA